MSNEEDREVKTFSFAANSNLENVKKQGEKKLRGSTGRSYRVEDTRRLQVNVHSDMMKFFVDYCFDHRLTVTDVVINLMANFMVEEGYDPELVENYRTGKLLPPREVE